MSGIEILMNGSCGVYLPSDFVNRYNVSAWSGINADQIEILSKGPEEELY